MADVMKCQVCGVEDICCGLSPALGPAWCKEHCLQKNEHKNLIAWREGTWKPHCPTCSCAWR